jgi:hypothetical protein
VATQKVLKNLSCFCIFQIFTVDPAGFSVRARDNTYAEIFEEGEREHGKWFALLFFFGDTKFEIFMKTTAKLIAW